MFLSNGIVWTFAEKGEVRRHLPGGDTALQDFLVENLIDSLEWLEAMGVELEPERTYLEYGRGRAASPPQMTAALIERIRLLGGRMLAGTAVQSLLTKDGAVTGALAFDQVGAIEVHARSVILATGGFQGKRSCSRDTSRLTLTRCTFVRIPGAPGTASWLRSRSGQLQPRG